jgi:hypothetical protein
MMFPTPPGTDRHAFASVRHGRRGLPLPRTSLPCESTTYTLLCFVRADSDACAESVSNITADSATTTHALTITALAMPVGTTSPSTPQL